MRKYSPKIPESLNNREKLKIPTKKAVLRFYFGYDQNRQKSRKENRKNAMQLAEKTGKNDLKLTQIDWKSAMRKNREKTFKEWRKVPFLNLIFEFYENGGNSKNLGTLDLDKSIFLTW